MKRDSKFPLCFFSIVLNPAVRSSGSPLRYFTPDPLPTDPLSLMRARTISYSPRKQAELRGGVGRGGELFLGGGFGGGLGRGGGGGGRGGGGRGVSPLGRCGFGGWGGGGCWGGGGVGGGCFPKQKTVP